MFENKKIYILGMARSGYEVAKMLAKKNNEILVTDLKEQNESHINELKSLGVQIVIGNAPMIDNSYDYLVKNPGIKDSHDIVTKAKELNIPVLNEIEVAYRLIDKDATIVGITGSNGKTTTTMLTYEILKNAKKKVILAGNMGFPLSPFVDEIDKDTILLMEISIQQLCNFSEYKTNISVLTNIYEAHLDFVGSKENYINIKKRIFNHHTSSDYAVLNYDNKDVVDNTNDIMSHKEYFSKNNTDVLCHIENGCIYYDNKKLIGLDDIKLKGNHNYENVMAAVMVAKRLNIDDEVICDTLKEFNGVEHRIEYVTNIGGVEIYNDSKSTNVKATQIALSTFNKPTILLLGGLDRKHSFEGLTEYMTNVKLIISFGETKDRIKEYADSINKDCIVVDNLKEATDTALSKAVFGDVVLLSPACASWDQFDSFEQRGEIFKSYINGGKNNE